MCVYIYIYINKDPAKSMSESKRTLNVEGGLLSAPCKRLVPRFRNLDSKDLGSHDLGMKNDRARGGGARRRGRRPA